jgi:hypothetical protein
LNELVGARDWQHRLCIAGRHESAGRSLSATLVRRRGVGPPPT